MAFRLGNYYIDEILAGTAQNSDEDLLYTLDQLSDASIEISADTTEITDKKGNVVRTKYNAKTGTFTATNAFLHPQLMNVASGSTMTVASSQNPIQMPRIQIIAAGASISVADAKTGTIKVIGIFGNGANDVPMTDEAIAALIQDNTLTAPAAGENLPIQYLVRYERDKEEGIMLTNDAEGYPDIVKLTLLCAYGDPCDDTLKPCYVVIPRFMADPNMTISLSAEENTMDFNGTLNVHYCATTKALYYIYFPGSETIVSGVAA